MNRLLLHFCKIPLFDESLIIVEIIVMCSARALSFTRWNLHFATKTASECLSWRKKSRHSSQNVLTHQNSNNLTCSELSKRDWNLQVQIKNNRDLFCGVRFQLRSLWMLKINWNVELWKFKIIIFSDNYFKVFYSAVAVCCVLWMFVCYHKKAPSVWTDNT